MWLMVNETKLATWDDSHAWEGAAEFASKRSWSRLDVQVNGMGLLTGAGET